MKCLKCGKNSLYRERSGGKCPQCGQRFVFEPKQGDLCSDTMFQKALELVSNKGSLAFTSKQLYYELARLRRRKPMGLNSKLASSIGTAVTCGIGGVVGGLLSVEVFHLKAFFWPLAGVYFAASAALVSWVWFKTDPSLITLKEADFGKLFQKWRKLQGLPAGYLDKPLALPTALPEKDLLDYAVERAIICDHPELVDFLLANNFHLEQKCLILTCGGYPKQRFEELRQMLRKNPQVHVFVLHNASNNGCRIYQELISSREWFPGSQRVFDIGLHPRHARSFGGLIQKLSPPQRLEIPGYTQADLEWLSKYKLEIMAIRPQQLLNRLRNVLNGHSKSLADAYAQGNTDGSTGGDLMIVAGDFSGGDDDFG